MSANTKIVVLRRKELLYTGIFAALGGVVHHITINAVAAGQGYGCLLWDTGFP